MSFAGGFWTSDYSSGFKVLFERLDEGIQENEKIIQLFTKRMDSEMSYGLQLKSIEESSMSNNKWNRDDDFVSTTRNAFRSLNENFRSQGECHIRIAEEVKSLIIDPFTTWCNEHKRRIKFSESTVNDKLKAFQNSKSSLEKLQKRYFNKCRLLEEFKSHYSDEDIDVSELANEEVEELQDEIFTLNDKDYSYQDVKSLLTNILTSIEITSEKVPILGTYNNCSSGASIIQWFLDNIPEIKNNVREAENFAQDLLDYNFIKLIGSMNKSFINSSKYYYQWKPQVFEITKLKYEQNNQIFDYFEDVKQVMGVNSVDFNDKSQLNKLYHEVNALDSQYHQKTLDLDQMRCEFEETVFDHLSFMEKCELDRLRAIKKVIYDFLSNFLSNFNSINKILNTLLVLEETIHPVNDLKFLIENFETGRFDPQVILYDNYYNSNTTQTFGVDLSTKSRIDKKVVPNLIQAILLYLDRTYPKLDNDEERIGLWTKPVSLSEIHKLRFEVNNLTDIGEIDKHLSESEPEVVTNLLKLYLIELPDSIVSGNLFDLIKSLYQLNPEESDSRINGIKNILVNVPKSNLATLDSILTHLLRLTKIISKKNPDLANDLKSKLSKELSNLILRPKNPQGGKDDKHSAKYDIKLTEKLQLALTSDFFEHKEIIFGDLRRKNSKNNELTPVKSTSSTSSKSKKTLDSEDEKPVNKDKASKKEKSVKKEKSSTKDKFTPSEDVPDMTPRTPSPEKTTSNSLKRSTSPNKKKLNSFLKENNTSKNVVSSKPSKKDIHYDSNPSSESLTELGKPQFVSGLSRRTSVKDLANKFDSATMSDS